MLTVTQLKVVLRAHGLRLSKRLGQHHLVDAQIIRRIVQACRLSHEETVVEIGAGLGALTEPLAEQAGRVIAVEVDRRICAVLAQRMRARPNVEVVCCDILDFALGRLGEVVVVGTIPYHITSPILVSLSERRRTIRRAILVVQQEVANRLLAKPATKAYGRLSVLVQYCWEMTKRLAVPASAFFPQPGVASVCLELRRRAKPPIAVDNEAAFFKVVKAAFAKRRKTLVNCLNAPDGLRLPRATAEAVVRGVGLPLSVRGEQLTLEQFAALSNAWGARTPCVDRTSSV